ncbi:MAG: hypothetical protein HKN06_06710 [Gammaproteobacteria bacterium]|nr:hypothetical protein [Gammaproteobacteria bacterium]
MLYLIGQIILCLLFTFVVGASVGWLLRGLGTSAQTETVEARWRARLAQLQQAQPLAVATADSGNEAAARNEIATLRQQVQQRDAAIRELRQQSKTPASRQTDAQSSRTEHTAQLNTRLQGHLAEQKATAKQLQAQLDRLANEKEMLIQRLRDRESEIGRMGQERQHAINTIASLQKEMRGLRGQALREAEAGAVAAADRSGDKTARAYQARPADQPAATTAAGSGDKAAPTATRPADPAATVTPVTPEKQRQQDLPISDAGRPQPETYEPDWTLTAPQGQKDNLQAIYGIGPKLEMQLNKIGVFHFRQIAGFSDKDILWVARHLKSFPGRIVRDQWIQQARTLAERQSG